MVTHILTSFGHNALYIDGKLHFQGLPGYRHVAEALRESCCFDYEEKGLVPNIGRRWLTDRDNKYPEMLHEIPDSVLKGLK